MAGNKPIKTQSFIRGLLEKAKLAIQNRKRKKLDKIMSMFLKQASITNDEVEKYLHVSDATATRYLSILVKEEKIKQNGKTGKSVFYILVK
jgi:predicted HTH transcriptional regulator